MTPFYLISIFCTPHSGVLEGIKGSNGIIFRAKVQDRGLNRCAMKELTGFLVVLLGLIVKYPFVGTTNNNLKFA